MSTILIVQSAIVVLVAVCYGIYRAVDKLLDWMGRGR